MAINVIPGGTGDTTFSTPTVKAAYDQFFELALRHQPLWRDLVDKRPVQVTNPGQTVTLFIHNDLAATTTPLTDFVDVTPMNLPAPSTVNVTVNGYGATIVSTEFLGMIDLADVAAYEAEQCAYHMENSLDLTIRPTINGGSNVLYARAGGVAGAARRASTVTVANGDIILSDDVREIVTKLRNNAAQPRLGQNYACYMHPYVSYDLRREVGDIGWRPVHTYSAPGPIWNGEIGRYEGAFFVETSRALSATDGATSEEVYRTVFCGRQALVEATAREPGIVLSGNVGQDYLDRLRMVGWKGYLGWSRFREPALFRLETASSLT
jgi:N4-gp56 family major capsid protein